LRGAKLKSVKSDIVTIRWHDWDGVEELDLEWKGERTRRTPLASRSSTSEGTTAFDKVRRGRANKSA
jgi:hypothetical protein